MSLIEIMIALTISLIVILAILRAYVSLGYVSAETTRGARIDANIMKGFMVADRILQGVGYNTVAPTNSYGTGAGQLLQAYKTISGTRTAVALDADADTVVWKLINGNCQALKSTGKGLVYYGGAGYACASGITHPDSLSPAPTPSQTIISTPTTMPSSVAASVGNVSLKVSKLSGSSTCTPFGIQSSSANASGGKYYVEIIANIYATNTSTTSSTISNSTCLFNLTT